MFDRKVLFAGWMVAGVGLCGGASATFAQTPQAPAQMNMADHRGGIAGTVRDAAGAPVAGANVTATNADTGAQYMAVADAQGAYTFAGALPPGKYDLSVELAGLTTFRQRGVDVAADATVQLNIALDAANAAQAAQVDRDQLLQKIATLEQRISDLESSAVLSEPETRVRRVEVFIDENGNQLDEPAPGATPTITYQRERVYRRQTISEKIEEALEDAENRKVGVGVDAAIATQTARRTEGPQDPDHSAYALASADLFFTAGLAQYTVFFADIVGLSGAPPDAEIPSLTLLNGYTARLVRQNELNLREAWMRTELFGQRLALTAGRLDLTNYFDSNAIANDESTQFISDALVNNQMLGLASNGTGFATEFDPKNGFRLKFGLQQSNNDATNLSDSLYTLTEVGYALTPFALPEGAYRVWFRTDNTSQEVRTGVGVSIDQKLTPVFGVFGRYGQQEFGPDVDRDHFYSVGVGFQNGFIFNPLDTWGIGYAQMDLSEGEGEKLLEGYYNFHLTERLRLSFHLTGVLDEPVSENKFGYLLPGIRFQAAF
ncbi:MAG TPA: carboxypeptidase regulatory-like domain-containing protein [Vicinamibacterales bacterium]|nr:carboxypeptidase regulatory-like domain-containing protein [Vicinamibacterales bacterium]